MQNAVLKFMMVILSLSLAPSPVMAIGLSTIICDNNSADWVGFRKQTSLFASTIYEMRPKKNLWIELAKGDYCESLLTGSNSFSCRANINGTIVTTLVDFDKLIYIKIINDDKTFTYQCIELN
jgi:hypothetical protein